MRILPRPPVRFPRKYCFLSRRLIKSGIAAEDKNRRAILWKQRPIPPRLDFCRYCMSAKASRQAEALQSELTKAAGQWKLTATIGGRIFRADLAAPCQGSRGNCHRHFRWQNAARRSPLSLWHPAPRAGGQSLVGALGFRLSSQVPALWDIGRPADELQKVVAGGKIGSCRVVDMCCGSGTDAIYLASKGFDVTAIDVAPTALGQA